MKNIFMAACLFLFSTCAMAQKLSIDNVKITDVAVYNGNGYNVITVHFDPGSAAVNTGCLSTDTDHIVSYLTTSGISGLNQSWIALFLTAQAQDLNVDIYYDNASCNTSSSWSDFGFPSGLGSTFWGANISNP